MQRLLDLLAKTLAVLGGLVLLAATALTVVSIVGRWRADAPVLGDVELMQVACAMAVALFLPYCQLRSGHIIVDFFTARATARTRGRLDAAGSALLAVAMLLLAWRAGVGVAEMKATGETTMVIGFPVWLTYLAMVPGLGLSGLIALAMAWRQWRGRAPNGSGA
jgi:TRAP-type C4-dicarboxylate transport system permease small subunit